MSHPIIFVTGRDPLIGAGGGSNYVRAHTRAAQRAGYEPHIFCLADRDQTQDADFGAVHRVRTPFRPRGPLKVSPNQSPEKFVRHWFNAIAFTPLMVGFHKRVLVAAIERFLRGRKGPHLIHGFYTWGCIGLDLRRRLRSEAVSVTVINSVYTTAEDEMRAKLEGLGAEAKLIERLLYAIEFGWVRVAVTRYERRAYRECTLVTANYEAVRRRFIELHGQGADFQLLPYTSETAFLREANNGRGGIAANIPGDAPDEPDEINEIREFVSSGAPLLVTVSRHDPRKGLDVLLRALSLVRAAGVEFRACFLSGGPLLESHCHLATELGLGDVVIFTGWVKDPYPYLQRADLFVLPSTQEGSGSLALIEALQAGLAIVASDVDGIPEDVTHDDNALLAPPGDAEGLAKTLIRALTDPALRRRLGGRARSTFDERFSPDSFAAALGELYAESLFS